MEQDTAPKRQQATRRPPYFGLGVFLVGCALIMAFLVLIRTGQLAALDRMQLRTERAAAAAMMPVAQTVAAANTMLADIAQVQPLELEELAIAVRAVPGLRAAFVLDDRGVTEATSDPALAGRSFATAPWFLALRQPPLDRAAGLEPGSGALALAVLRRGGRAGFSGAAVGLLDLPALIASARATLADPAMTLRLYTAGGVLLGGSDVTPAEIGHRDRTLQLSRQAGGAWVDEAVAVHGYAMPPGLDLVVVVSEPIAFMPARTAPFAWRILLLFGLLAAGLLGVLLGMRRQARRLGWRIEALMRSEADAVAACRAKQDFLATMSHEIRTPLNAVIGMTELLTDTALDAEQLRYAETIQGSAEHLLGVLNELLDYARVESAAVELESTAFLPEEEVSVVAELFAPAMAVKGVELVCRFADGVPTSVIGDPGRFRQVLLNLVGHAARSTERGWIEISVAAEPANRGQIMLCCKVADTGVGPEASGLAAGRPGGGPGLGLVICGKLVAAMGGTVAAATRPGGGGEISFDIRVTPQDGPAPPETRPLAGRRCLVVDDLAINREILSRQLVKLGAEVVTAEDAFGGLRLLRENAAAPFDIALIDRAMPLMDGLAMARVARSEGGAGGGAIGARLLVLCASGRLGDMSDPAGLFGAVLLKPVMSSRLRALAMLLSEPPAPLAAAPSIEPGTVLAGRLVLLAEDNPTNQIVTSAMLQRAGAAVEVVEDGAAAAAAAACGAFDLVLMDIQMPGVDGLTATRRIRADEAARGAPRVPIIGLTAGIGGEAEAACREAGMDCCLGKPIGREALIRAVVAGMSRVAPA